METKLDPKFKEKWIAALRSGEYQQAKGKLFDGIGYCCLGVACVINGVPLPRDSSETIPIGTMGVPAILTGQGNGHVKTNYNPLVNKLATMNDGTREDSNPDGKQYSFNEIADYIEKNL